MKDTMQDQVYLEIKKFMIQSSRDFSCPITGEILDVDRSEIVRVNGESKSDFVVSTNGWNKLNTSKLKPGIIVEKITAETL